jgi:Bacteriocin-protection, YdeI or OmpD-Associated
MNQTLFEKLQLKDEKNLLIQGLPSTIEKQFAKVSFAKNVTPLLKTRKIDFALVFAISESQLNGILKEVMPALHEECKFWVAYPKVTSKIATDLNRDCSWYNVTNAGYEGVRQVALDHVWSAIRFKKGEQIEVMTRASANGGTPASVEGVDHKARTVTPPDDFTNALKQNKKAADFFEKLSFSNKKEYVTWIAAAKKTETRLKRIETAVEKLLAGKKNPSEK